MNQVCKFYVALVILAVINKKISLTKTTIIIQASNFSNSINIMSLRKRAALGFDDGSSDEEVEKPQPLRKSKLPKLSFKTQEIKENDIDDVRPTLGKEEDPEAILGGDDDYMRMVITEDEKTGPQRLQPKDETKTKPGYNFEEIQDKKESKPASLFGQLESSRADDSTLQPMPKSQLKNSSKGLSIMEKMGFKIGDTLGKDSKNKKAILEPILVLQREDRTGIKEGQIKIGKSNKTKAFEGITNEDAKEFRERLTDEQNTQRQEKILHKMQKYCLEFSGDGDAPDIEKVDPLGINVLWRGYVKFVQKLLKDKREQRRIKNPEEIQEIQQDGENSEEEDNDEELELFEELTIEEKVRKLHLFLRTEFDYCYYCGAKYEDQGDLYEHCPGFTEEDHV